MGSKEQGSINVSTNPLQPSRYVPLCTLKTCELLSALCAYVFKNPCPSTQTLASSMHAGFRPCSYNGVQRRVLL